jgi:hypothetical protein
MLTFSRKFRQRFVESGQARKYFLYAIGEIMLVMIGILLALQVNKWNEERKNRTLEIQYLTEIKQELEINNNELQSDLNSHFKSMKKMIEVRDHIINQMPPNDSLSESIYTAKGDYQAYPKTASFENLKTIGMSLLQNDTLNNMIGYCYGALLTRILDRGDNNAKYDIEILLAPYLKRHLRIDPLQPEELQSFSRSNEFMSHKWKIKDHDALLRDDEFLRDLKLGMIQRGHKISSHQNTISIFEEAIQMIEEEVERRVN